jgi:hypothetical protein
VNIIRPPLSIKVSQRFADKYAHWTKDDDWECISDSGEFEEFRDDEDGGGKVEGWMMP